MYDDASYYTFIPSAQASEDRSKAGKHLRKQSLLKPPDVRRSAVPYTSKYEHLRSDFLRRRMLELTWVC